MKITELELEVEDIEWYAVDESGRIAQFTSGGSPMVPAFVCECRERLNDVCRFFEKTCADSRAAVHFNEALPPFPRSAFLHECKQTEQKGLYCFTMLEEQGVPTYWLVCKPSFERMLFDLPPNIQKQLYALPKIRFDESTKIRF